MEESCLWACYPQLTQTALFHNSEPIQGWHLLCKSRRKCTTDWPIGNWMETFFFNWGFSSRITLTCSFWDGGLAVQLWPPTPHVDCASLWFAINFLSAGITGVCYHSQQGHNLDEQCHHKTLSPTPGLSTTQDTLGQWFSTLLMLWPFNIVPCVVVNPPTIKLFLLLHNSRFATVMNHDVNICVFWWS